MGKTSEIEWTDATWNPWYGCRKVSAGCKLCYAERDMTRYGRDFSKVTRAAPATFNAPLKWKEGRRIFTCSWSDFFIEEADPWRAEAWEIIRQTPQHTYLILTKRPDRMTQPGCIWLLPWGRDFEPWPHVMFIASVEDQPTADKRIVELLSVPAAHHGLSYEPALGAIDLTKIQFGWIFPEGKREPSRHNLLEPITIFGDEGDYNFPGLDLVIIGGESARRYNTVIGPMYGWREGARAFHLEWAFDALAQCRAAGVACFIKQLGSNPYYRGQPLKLRDWKGGDMSEWLEELRVREFPHANYES